MNKKIYHEILPAQNSRLLVLFFLKNWELFIAIPVNHRSSLTGQSVQIQIKEITMFCLQKKIVELVVCYMVILL